MGAERINSLSDTNKAARICAEVFDNLRDNLLANHPWNFAIKRQALAQSTTDPVFGFDYSFVIPSDCIRIIGANLGDEEWVEEGDQVLSNFTDTKIKYIARITDISKWSEGFKEALYHKIAVHLSYSLVQSTTLARELKNDYLTVLRDAKGQDAQASGVMIVEADEWLNSRF